MSEGAFIAIAVVAVIAVIGLVAALPCLEERSRLRTRQHELEQRRDQVSAEHSEQASLREGRAEQAERRARLADKEAQRERAEAELHAERAGLHEQGLADDELVEERERERFAGTSAVADRDAAWPDEPEPGAAWRERDRDRVVPRDERPRPDARAGSRAGHAESP